MTRDYRDNVIETLADSEHALAETSAGLREALSVALDMLREREGELTRLREQHHRLIDEYRTYRATTISAPRRAA